MPLIGTSTFVYDSAGQLTNQQDKNGSGTVLNNFTYTYDSAGNVKTQVLGGTTTTYSYNAANELTNDTANSYSYEAAGNRNMTGYQTGTGNELKNDGTWTYTYDSEGNMTEKSQGANATTWFYTFDNNNQMTTAQQFSKASGGTLQAAVTYVYDALQNRIEVDSWTQSSGTTTVTRFGYDANQVWVDLNSNNQLQTRCLHGDVIDQLFARINSAGTAAWYLTDRLESIRGMVDNAGALQETVAYDGYGNITSDSNSSFGDRYKFTGRELDSVTGLQYNRARYYLAPVGRWLSQDPLGFGAGDGNLFRYVSNAPTDLRDPTGQVEWYSALVDPKPNQRGMWVAPPNEFRQGIFQWKVRALADDDNFALFATFTVKPPGGKISQSASVTADYDVIVNPVNGSLTLTPAAGNNTWYIYKAPQPGLPSVGALVIPIAITSNANTPRARVTYLVFGWSNTGFIKIFAYTCKWEAWSNPS